MFKWLAMLHCVGLSNTKIKQANTLGLSYTWEWKFQKLCVSNFLSLSFKLITRTKGNVRLFFFTGFMQFTFPITRQKPVYAMIYTRGYVVHCFVVVMPLVYSGFRWSNYINGLVQNWKNCIAYALELLWSYTRPLIYLSGFPQIFPGIDYVKAA